MTDNTQVGDSARVIGFWASMKGEGYYFCSERCAGEWIGRYGRYVGQPGAPLSDEDECENALCPAGCAN